MSGKTVNITVKGKRVPLPAFDFQDKVIAVRGSVPKIAFVHDEWWIESELQDPEACLAALKQRRSAGFRADLLTFAPKMPGSQPKYSYHTEMDSIAAARTSNFKQWWESLPQESRKNVRRSQKRGVVVEVRKFDDELINGIMGVNNDSSVRQGGRNAHYGKPFEEVKADHESFLDRSDFICAVADNTIIGYLKLVYKGDVAALLNLAVKPSETDKRPANALMAKAVELCEQKGVQYLTYGMFNYGNKRDSPLREFKIRNGFEEVLTPRYFVPLTPLGSLSLKLGLHRGLLGILPHQAITWGLKTRARWYNFKSSLAGVAQR